MQQGEVSTQQAYQQKTYYERPERQQQVDIDITAPDINIGDIILKKDANSAIETAINSVISSLVWKGVGAGLGKLKDYIKSKSSIGEHNAFKLEDLETPKLQQQLKPEGKDALQKDLQKLKSPLDTIKQFGEEQNNSQLKSIGDSGLKILDGINQTMDLLENTQGAAELINKVPQLVDQVKKYTKVGQKMMTILDAFSAPKEGDPSIVHEAKRLLDTVEGQAEYLDKIKPYSEKAAKLLTDINNVQESIKSQYSRLKNIFKPKITSSQLQTARLNDLQKIATYDLYSTTGKEYFNNIETIQNSTKSLQELVNENKTQSLKKNIENLNTIYKALPEYAKTLKDFNDNPGEFVKHRAEQLLSYDPKFNESQLKNDLQRDLTVNNTFYKYFHDNNIKTEYNGTKIDFSKMSKQQVDDIIQKHYSTKPKTNDLLLQQEIFEDQYQFNPEFRQNISKNYTQYNPLQRYTAKKNKQLKQATSPMSLLKNADLIDYPLEQTAQTLNNYHRAYPLQTVNKYIDSLREYPRKSKEYRLPDIQREQQQAQKIIDQMPNIQENPYFKKYQLNDNLIQQRINQLEKNIKIPIQDQLEPIPKNMYNKYMSQLEDYNNPKNLLYYKEPQKLNGAYRHTARTNAEINDYKKIHYDPIYQFEQLTKEPIQNVDFEDANNRIRDENIRIQEMSKQLSDNKKELSGLKKYKEDVAIYNKSKKYQNLFKNPDYLKTELYYQQLMDLYSGKRYLHTKPTFSNANQLDSEENHKFILDYMTKGQVNPGTLETTTFQKGGKIIPANEELTNKLQNLYKTTANKLSSSKSVDFQNIIDNYNKQYADIIDKHLLDYPIGNNRIITEQSIDEFNRQYPTTRLSDISMKATSQDFVKYKQLKPKERTQAKRQINSQHQEEINRGQKLNYEKLYNEDLEKQANDINQKMTETKLNTESLEEFKTYAQNRHIQQNFIKDIPTSNNQILQALKNTTEYQEPITKIQQQQRQGLLNAEIQGDKYYPSFNKTFKFNPKDNTPENLVVQHLKDSLSDYGLAGNSKDITSLIKQLPEEDQQKFFTQNKDIIDNIDIRTENNKELQDLKKYQYKQYGYKPDDYEYIRRQLVDKFLQKYATQENINKTVETLKQLIQQ